MAGPRAMRYPLPFAAAMLALAGAAHADSLAKIVDRFATPLLQQGYAEGLEVAVVIGSATPAFFSYGYANVAKQAAPDPDTLFQIASVTKVFTTNLLGQAQNADPATLGKTLADYGTELGTLPANTAQVTLQDLGDFTGGFPSYASFCTAGETPANTGCLPNHNLRPTITQYTGADFAAFFRTYQTAGAPPLGYLYSDYSLGLLGLLLGATPGQPLSNDAFYNWEGVMTNELLTPLKLYNTFAQLPPFKASRLALGYTQAIASADISGGKVTGLTPIDPGAGYTAAPTVSITGGGGSGAAATAQIGGGSVTGFTVTSGGSGYTAPATVTFSAGTVQATGSAIIQAGHVVGVNILAGGSYSSAPTVTFTGGRVGGHAAAGTVFVDHSQVTFVQITDGGAGYVDPVAVTIAPGPATALPVPIWAPAGALKSSARDLATFAAAALGQTTIGTITVPAAITAGFAIAEMPYACEKGSPSLSGCTAAKSGLAWDILTAAPRTVSKDGGLPGYSSFVVLMPAQNAAAVVLANSLNNVPVAPVLGREILGALYHEGKLPAAH